MKNIRRRLSIQRRTYTVLVVAFVAVCLLLLYKLGSLVSGLSLGEVAASHMPVGWHGIYHQPLDLPLKLVRSAVFFLYTDHGNTLTRLPNTLFGLLAIFSFVWLVKLWHGTRTALFAGCLFACSAWVLHVSRLASFDVLYLWALPALLVVHAKLQRQGSSAMIFYGSMLLWGLLLYVPGLVWLLIIEIYTQRKAIASGWRHFSAWWQRLLYLLAGLIWLPLLADRLREVTTLKTWLGLPQHLDPPLTLLKHFGAVFVHLFVRGPEYPTIWLGRAPILDIFTLVTCLIGIYFYVRNFKASRSRLLGSFFIVGAILIALGGPVSLSLLVPVAYLLAATGIAYLIREWLQTFPVNPLARGVGVGLIILAVALSCTYNLRAYFVAWPHNDTTKATFLYRP
jgi:hypothetical protein